MLRKILSPDLNSNFIEQYDNSLSVNECQILINQFEKSKHCEGSTNKGVVPEEKKCIQLIGPRFSDASVISGIIESALSGCMIKYKEKYSDALSNINWWKLADEYSFQKYDGENDGYKAWHCEHGTGSSSYRILAWMIYLNDAKSGTEFRHYPTIRAKMGRCVIWPSGLSYLHRGVTPNKGLKYITTGWYSYYEK